MSAAALPAAVLPRLGSLLRLLGSDQDGEVLGEARAIGRVLAGAGLGLHDLAAAVERPAGCPCCREREPVRPCWEGWSRHGGVALPPEQSRAVSAALQRALSGGRLTEAALVDKIMAAAGYGAETTGEAA